MMIDKNTTAEQLLPVLKKHGLRIVNRINPVKTSALNLEKYLARQSKQIDFQVE